MMTEVRDRERDIETLLTRALAKDPTVSFGAGIRRFEPAVFDKSNWTLREPDPANDVPVKQGVVARMLPGSCRGAAGRQARRVEDATQGFAAEGGPDAASATVGYSVDSRHLVVDLELPEISVVPEEASFRYVKTADRIDSSPRPVAKRKALYAQLLNVVSLKGVDTVFRADAAGVVDCLTLNGMLDAVDPATGRDGGSAFCPSA